MGNSGEYESVPQSTPLIVSLLFKKAPCVPPIDRYRFVCEGVAQRGIVFCVSPNLWVYHARPFA